MGIGLDGIEKDYTYTHELVHQFPIEGNFLLFYNETLKEWGIEGVLEDGEEYELPLKSPLNEDLVTDYFTLKKEFYDKVKGTIRLFTQNK